MFPIPFYVIFLIVTCAVVGVIMFIQLKKRTFRVYEFLLQCALFLFVVSPLSFLAVTVVLTQFFAHPHHALTYVAVSPAESLVVELPLEVVRMRIITAFDPFSSLIPQPSPEERAAKEAADLDMHNKLSLGCVTGETPVETCQQLQGEAMDSLNSLKSTSEQKQFSFMVASGTDLTEANMFYAGMLRLYEENNRAPGESVLNYIRLRQDERENDLWLQEDLTGMSADWLIESPSDLLDESRLKKFRLTSEYLYEGRPVLGTSDYIVRLRSISPTSTSIDLVPLFPRVLAGVRFETGCHAWYCPRWVYDLQFVGQFDEEQNALLGYIADMFNKKIVVP